VFQKAYCFTYFLFVLSRFDNSILFVSNRLSMNKEPPLLPSELKLCRARLGFTQQKLAWELGVSRVSVVRWETGMCKIPFRETCTEVS
jgi:DNA-binding XRE family transcriptional regulator